MLKVLGKNPSSDRLKRMEASPNYRDGVFQNVHPTPMNKEGKNTLGVVYDFITTKKPSDQSPSQKIPGFKINLNEVADNTPTLVWFGHSSYLIKYKGKNILVDPVFCGHASPVSSVVKAFEGTDLYSVHDMPQIDLLILTHDHYDHIDFETVSKLKAKTKQVVCPLGCGEHLEYWGYQPDSFVELDWWEHKEVTAEIKVTATPARHFAGRGLVRNKTLWASYVLELGGFRIFIGGDSGYDDQFKKIGEKFKSFDLAMIECGQYGENWPYIHMFPEQTAQAAKDLNAKVLFPVHWGKFILSLHSWTEPVERVSVKAKELNQKIITPRIGEIVRLPNELPNSKWWREIS